MNLHIKTFVPVVFLAMATVSTPSLAQDTGWYAGVGIGQATYKDACDGIAGPGISCDDTDMAFKILGGYQVNPNFAVEFGYGDLGKTEASFAGLGSATIEASGFEVLAVGIAPINQQWSMYGKLGFFRWDVDLKDGTGLIGSASASGTDLTYGFGVQYRMTKAAALRIEYQQYNDAGDPNTTGEGDASVMGVGVTYRF